MGLFSRDPELNLSGWGGPGSTWVEYYPGIDFPAVTRETVIPGSFFRKRVWGGNLHAVADSRAVQLLVDLGVNDGSNTQDEIFLPPHAPSLRAVAELLERIAKDVEEHADDIRKDAPKWYREHRDILRRNVDWSDTP